MKKLLNKIRRKPKKEAPSRITTETIAEHRERILAGGRRFKYPVQYSRHKLVFNAILIGVGVIIFLVVFIWWQLYSVQNTSDFMYRVTRVIPVPVASVEGQAVRYSDYLLIYRSSIHYAVEKEQVNLSTEDGKRMSDYFKQESMKNAVADAYAQKLARERNITVTDAELEAYLQLQRESSGEVSSTTYDTVVLDYYGWSPEEYRHVMKLQLLRQKVSYDVDTTANTLSERIQTAISGGNSDLKAVTDSINGNSDVKVTFGVSGMVPKNNQDGGLALAASKLQRGAVSTVVKSTSGDGYYFVKLVDSSATQVNYEYIHIPLTVFDTMVSDADVAEFIRIPDVEAPQE